MPIRTVEPFTNAPCKVDIAQHRSTALYRTSDLGLQQLAACTNLYQLLGPGLRCPAVGNLDLVGVTECLCPLAANPGNHFAKSLIEAISGSVAEQAACLCRTAIRRLHFERSLGGKDWLELELKQSGDRFRQFVDGHHLLIGPKIDHFGANIWIDAEQNERGNHVRDK